MYKYSDASRSLLPPHPQALEKVPKLKTRHVAPVRASNIARFLAQYFQAVVCICAVVIIVVVVVVVVVVAGVVGPNAYYLCFFNVLKST